MSSSWHVYVLRCADGSLYTGITTDVERRLREHEGADGRARRGAAYTRSRRPVRLVYVRPAADRSAATRTELAIKRLPRAAKERLVADGCADAGPERGPGIACNAPPRLPSSPA